jgi:putative ABC transport system permease protein
LPGVVAVTTTNAVPASGSGWGDDLYTRADMPSNEAISYGRFMTDEQGLAAYGLELVAGRNFRADEVLEVSEQKLEFPNVMIISQALADELFPDGNALGQTIWDEPNGQKPRQIIGIYGHMQNAWPHSEHVNRTGFEPVRLGLGGRMMYMLRTEPGQRDPVMRAAEDYLSENRNRIIDSVRSFNEVKRRTYSRDIAMVKLLSAVITVLVAVTGLGIVGLAWFSVTQRRRQIGTRRALGATRMDIVRYFMIENWLITTAGLAVGVVATLALNWLLDTQYEVGRVPLWFLPAGVVVLWILGQLAVLLPARRAAAIPPALATRSV